MDTRALTHEIYSAYGETCVPPELGSDDQARFDEQLALQRAELARNYPSTRILAANVDRGQLYLRWYQSEYAHVLAWERRRVPSGREHPGLTLVTHLRCRDGWVTTRRSGAVAVDTGRWQGAAAEWSDLDDLDGPLNFDVIARRSLARELGLAIPDVHARRAVFQPGGPRINHRLYLVVELDELDFDEIQEWAVHAPDAWENDRVEVRRPGGNGTEIDRIWWPDGDRVTG